MAFVVAHAFLMGNMRMRKKRQGGDGESRKVNGG